MYVLDYRAANLQTSFFIYVFCLLRGFIANSSSGHTFYLKVNQVIPSLKISFRVNPLNGLKMHLNPSLSVFTFFTSLLKKGRQEMKEFISSVESFTSLFMFTFTIALYHLCVS